ncbi:murein hydrolase activator EnvC [Rhizobium sp. L1K21]|uniref:murein hydrolase activator EnvC family protein n=1 Tax=Rhizobium sp. L1K21 TaxID=2954933 RepID=UPI0020930D81|nr:murein hydrolase activator EnvC [Rhizobium sp. L1K21]MCO6184808.1 murein hydrolase activator EnvC [Rhizobium sp. L1K21]
MKTGRRLPFVLMMLGATLAPSGLARLHAEETVVEKPKPNDPAADLEARRKATEEELKALSESIGLSDSKIGDLQSEIAELNNRAADIRQALVSSAETRNALETKISQGEKKLTALREQESDIRASLYERRGLLAEVLGALERMGRNPPPAILVKPSDALGSVRSAILLGAVVPGIREETETLYADLQQLSKTLAAISSERESLKQLMVARLEEEKRMSLLLEENRQQSALSAKTLAEEQKRAEALAAKASSMQELMASLEAEIGSVREAAQQSREAEAGPKNDATDQGTLPDKNRIAPAFAFSSLKGRLALPVRGELVADGEAEPGPLGDAQGVTVIADAGALVTAPADGWIIYAGAFRSYGETIILDVGEKYRLVMTGMGNVNVRPGQFVVAGEPIGEMGETRIASAASLSLETDRPSLYIELWQNNKPTDSRAWWSAQNSGKASNDT